MKKTMKRYHPDILSKDFTINFIAGLGGGATFWFFTLSPLLALEIVVSVFFVFAVIVMLWVGYTIMTTPSIEDIEKKK